MRSRFVNRWSRRHRVWRRDAYREYRAMYRAREFLKASELGMTLLRSTPDDELLRRSVASSLDQAGDAAGATSILLQALPAALVGQLREYDAMMQRQLRLAPGAVPSLRLLPKGVSNVCIIDHGEDADGYAYVTKVLRGRARHLETAFYREIRAHSEEVARLAPSFVRAVDLARFGMTLLTIEKISGRQPARSEAHRVVRAHQSLRSVSFGTLPHSKNRLIGQRVQDTMHREAAWRLRGKIALRATLSWIHYTPVSETLLRRLTRMAAREGWPRSSTVIVRRVERAMRGVRRDHLSALRGRLALAHGDFHLQNVLIDERDDRVRVIDWESYRWALPHVDLTRLFTDRFEFRDVESHLEAARLWPAEAGPDAQHVLMLYALIVAWLVSIQSGDHPSAHDDRFEPAVDRLETVAGKLAS